MANNRMYLRCKACGETFFLGKRMSGGYYIRQYEQYKGIPLMERLNKFYYDHEWCGNAGLDCFELIYEDSPEPTNNADRIRAMSDEELAEFLWNRDIQIVERASKAAGFNYHYDEAQCIQNILDWLKAPAEVGE